MVNQYSTSQDIVLGIYYLFQAEDKDKKPKGIFSSIEEIEQLLRINQLGLHSRIISHLKQLIKTEIQFENIQVLPEDFYWLFYQKIVT